MDKTREKQGGYHGVENVKFAKRENGTYSADILLVLYAKSIKLTPKVSSTPVEADNKTLFKIPSDTGLEGELKTTAPDPELDKVVGFSIEGSSGLIDVNMTSFAKGALYFEFIGYDKDGASSRVKVWLFNVELGKGEKTYNTKKGSVELGDYAYTVSVNGDPFMSADGTTIYYDARGMDHLAFQYASYPGDAD